MERPAAGRSTQAQHASPELAGTEEPSPQLHPHFAFGGQPGVPPQQRSRLWVVAAGVALAAILLWALSVRLGRRTEAPTSGPLREPSAEAVRTANVERRDFVRSLRLHGVVEAMQSYTVAAPRLAGQGLSSLVITRLAPTGAAVRRGDLLVEFDRQNQIKAALDRQAEYRDLVEQIKKKQAEHAAARARDETELKQAENAVEAASLEMKKNEILARIDAERNQLNLEEARARLQQLRETFELKRRAAQAELRTLEIQRDRAGNAMRHAQVNSEKMAIRALLDGLVVLNTIWKSGQMAEVQEGDEVRAGVPFLQVVNPAAMQVRVRVNQADVPYLRVGQAVQVRLDAYPDLMFAGKLERLAAIGVSSDLSQKVRSFVALFSIAGGDPKLLPDLSAAVDVELERSERALVAPRDAVWTEGEQPYVRVARGNGFEKRAVKTGPVNDLEVVIESGVEAGAVVQRGFASKRAQARRGLLKARL